ncbi:MAG: acetate--CoA ligase family protein, partial [Chlamydiota bacterium]|nr:acetate--CoA ligase family protein [Chlamydiota bacterium]
MKVHEYQAKALLQSYAVPVSTGEVAENLEQAQDIIKKFSSNKIIVKAQIHAGGRGKAGGVKVCTSQKEALESVKEMLGKRIKTHQTGPDGLPVNHVLLESSADIQKELYVAITLDRDKECPVIICSAEGGMDIEEIAAVHPDKIIKEWIHP